MARLVLLERSGVRTLGLPKGLRTRRNLSPKIRTKIFENWQNEDIEKIFGYLSMISCQEKFRRVGGFKRLVLLVIMRAQFSATLKALSIVPLIMPIGVSLSLRALLLF